MRRKKRNILSLIVIISLKYRLAVFILLLFSGAGFIMLQKVPNSIQEVTKDG